MLKKRIITSKERDTIINNPIQSRWSLGVLFYIMGLLLPILIVIVLTNDFKYFYILIIMIIGLAFIIFIYPIIFKRHVLNDKIYCFDTWVLSCKKSSFYYYTAEINGFDDNFIEYHYPVKKKLKKNQTVTVIMLMGENRYSKYYLLDKKTGEMLTSKRTRFDLVK